MRFNNMFYSPVNAQNGSIFTGGVMTMNKKMRKRKALVAFLKQGFFDCVIINVASV